MLKSTARFLPLLLGATVLLSGCQAGDPPPPATRTVLVQAAASAPSSSGVYTGEVRARHEVGPSVFATNCCACRRSARLKSSAFRTKRFTSNSPTPS